MKDEKEEKFYRKHMKGFIHGFIFIIVIILIIGFFQLIGYIDEQLNGPVPVVGAKAETWNDNRSQSEGIYNKSKKKEMNNSAQKEDKLDFGSKSLNQKDRDEVDENKSDKLKKSFKNF